MIPDTKGLTAFPGGGLVQKGLRDLTSKELTDEALLVLIARPRLELLGFTVLPFEGLERPYEHRLYERLEDRNLKRAHVDYNALLPQMANFANA